MSLPLDVVAPSLDVYGVVEDAIRAFAKAYRATQLYLPNNPTRLHALEQARAAFARAWPVIDPIELHIQESTLLCEDRVVYSDVERATEGLPWLLYRDGLRVLVLQSGFETDSLDALLGILQRVRTMSPDEDDLVTMLWVADLAGVQYRHVENTGSMNALAAAERADAMEHSGSAEQLAVPGAETEPVGDGPPGLIRLDDFDATLYFLDPGEIAYLQDEVRREYTEDPRRKVLAVLFDIVAMPVAMSDRLDALQSIEGLLVEFLVATEIELVALLMQEAAAVRATATDTPELEIALAALPIRVSEPNAMSQLLQALDDGSRAPNPGALEALFAELHPEALRSLLGWLSRAAPSAARAAVERASVRLASAHTAELARLLESPEPAVARGALQAAITVATPATVPALARLLAASAVDVRAAAVTALRAIPSPGAAQALEPAVEDVERDIRVSALKALASRRHAAALPRLRGMIRRRELRSADLGEKMALFEAFASVCGEAGVPELDALLNARGLLGPREPTEVRACAARALGLVGGPAANAALEKASGTKDSVVRSAVTRALRGVA